MATYTMNCYLLSTDGRSSSALGTLTQDIDSTTIAVADTIAYKTYASSYLFQMVRVRANGPGSAFIGGTIPLTATTDNTLYFYFVTKLYIAEFSWTDDDATKIVKGASASNLTASAYNSFYQKLGSMRSITSTTYYASNAVNAGDTVTANKMLTLSNGVYRALMYLYGSPNSIQDEFYMETQREIASGKPITAEILSTGEYSLKNMLNRIILALRP